MNTRIAITRAGIQKGDLIRAEWQTPSPSQGTTSVEYIAQFAGHFKSEAEHYLLKRTQVDDVPEYPLADGLYAICEGYSDEPKESLRIAKDGELTDIAGNKIDSGSVKYWLHSYSSIVAVRAAIQTVREAIEATGLYPSRKERLIEDISEKFEQKGWKL